MFQARVRLALPLLLLLLLCAAPLASQATSFHQEDLVCGNCGQTSPQRILSGFFFPFPPDMDLQPLQLMLRAADLRECPHCGYVALDFSTPVNGRDKLTKWNNEAAEFFTSVGSYKIEELKKFMSMQLVTNEYLKKAAEKPLLK